MDELPIDADDKGIWRNKLYPFDKGELTLDESSKYLNFLYKNKILLAKDMKFTKEETTYFKNFTHLDSCQEVQELIDATPMEYRNFYEVILGQEPQKPHFDLDIDADDGVNHELILSDFLKVLRACLCAPYADLSDLSNDILVCSSHGTNKWSYHVILPKYYHSNCHEALYICNKIKTILTNNKSPAAKYLDTSVYKSVQQFRLLYCTKLDKNRFKKIDKTFKINGTPYTAKRSSDRIEELMLSMITCVDVNTMKHISVQVSMPKNIEDKDQTTLVKKRVNAIYPTLEFDKKESFCYSFRNRSGYHCLLCNRVHEHENPFVTIHNINKTEKDIRFWCRRNQLNYKVI